MSKLPHEEEYEQSKSVAIEKPPKKTDMESWQRVHDAIKAGDLEELQRLIEQEMVDVNIRIYEELNDTPLHIAAHYGMSDIAYWLVLNGADVCLKDRYGYTPLSTAICCEKKYVVQRLLSFKGVADEATTNYDNYIMLMLLDNNLATREIREVFVDALKTNFPQLIPHNKVVMGAILGDIELIQEQPGGYAISEVQQFLFDAGYDATNLYERIYGYNVSCISDSGSAGDVINMEVQTQSLEPKKTDMESWQRVHDAIEANSLSNLRNSIDGMHELDKVQALNSFENFIRSEVMQIAVDKNKNSEVMNYVRSLLQQKSMYEYLDEYLYASILVSYLWHVSEDNSYKECCESLYVELNGIRNRFEGENSDALNCVLKKLFVQLQEPCHSSITFKMWQSVYARTVYDLSMLRQKMIDSIDEEKLEDVEVNFMCIQSNFTRENLDILKTNILEEAETLLTKIEFKSLGLLMEDAKVALVVFVDDLKNFIYQFDNEASFVGGVENYFDELEFSTNTVQNDIQIN
ncbi:MAG: ankyrin repeat domain-containing protein [Rickettsiaceae bacterium]|nr:ankyrin repeat domain-containing protein [Rickettsiaceae bacterium]